MIHTGDCIAVMAGMPAESVDAVVTDPPYGIGFMGKVWDAFDQNAVEASWSGKGRNHTSERNPDASTPGGRSTTRTGFRETNPRCGTCGRVTRGRDTAKGFKVCHCETPVLVGTPNRDGQRFQAWCEAWGREALRVTKPGGYLLAFGGTRTHHRLVCGLEDAGWIIRDELDWIYASGFPKGKANLKPAHEPIVLARKPGPLRPLAIDACRIGLPEDKRAAGSRSYQRAEPGGRGQAEYQDAPHDGLGRWPSNLLLSDPALFDEPNPEVVGSGATNGGGEFSFSGERADRDNPVYGKANLTRHSPDNYGDTGGYSRFFIIPKSARGDREPTLRESLDEVYCNCKTVKPDGWEKPDLSQVAQTASTSRARAISAATSADDSDSSMTLFGSSTSGPSHQDSRSTTPTGTSSITGSRTSKPSIPSPTSGSTPGASSSTASGGSDARPAASTGNSPPNGGTSAVKAGRSTVDADPAISPVSSTISVCVDCGKLRSTAAVGGADGVTRAARRNSHPT